jgi:hypothetical protein
MILKMVKDIKTFHEGIHQALRYIYRKKGGVVPTEFGRSPFFQPKYIWPS